MSKEMTKEKAVLALSTKWYEIAYDIFEAYQLEVAPGEAAKALTRNEVYDIVIDYVDGKVSDFLRACSEEEREALKYKAFRSEAYSG